MGKINNLFSVIMLLFYGNDDAIRNDVINVIRSHRRGKSEIIDLNRSRAKGKNSSAAVSGETGKINDDINFHFAQEHCHFMVAFISNVDESVERLRYAQTHRG